MFVGLQIYEVVNNAEARKRVTCFSEAAVAHSMCGNSRFGDAICLFDVATSLFVSMAPLVTCADS